MRCWRYFAEFCEMRGPSQSGKASLFGFACRAVATGAAPVVLMVGLFPLWQKKKQSGF